MDEISSFLLSVVESSSDAIVGLKPNGHIVSWNPAAEKIYGYTAEELIGEPVTRLSLPDRAKETPLILTRTLSGERVRHFQTVHLRKNGVPIPVSLSISPVIDNLDRVVGASLITRDLSHQMTFEKTLHESEQRYQKLKSSLELAHQVQETLLPKREDTSCELDIYATTLYSEDVGGDYYDFFHPADSSKQTLGLAVGDVSGHGTAAALLMAMAKGALQSEVKHCPFDLVAVMSRMNQFFIRQAKEGLFMTLFLALVDIPARSLRWCSAGQGPVYIYHPRQQYFQELSSTGTPLGVLAGSVFECNSTGLRDGDILIVGTDGLWESRNPGGELFSVGRFRQLLATWHRRSAQEICSQMLDRVKKFTASNELEDDISLLIIKVPTKL